MYLELVIENNLFYQSIIIKNINVFGIIGVLKKSIWKFQYFVQNINIASKVYSFVRNVILEDHLIFRK